eukprot:3395864-Alexandrium_andersonii.AAC.1
MQCMLGGQKLRDVLVYSDREKVEEIVRDTLDWVSTKRREGQAGRGRGLGEPHHAEGLPRGEGRRDPAGCEWPE